MAVQRERLKGGKTGEDSHRQLNAGWKTGRPWLDFWKVTTTDLDSAGNSVLVTAMFCKFLRDGWLQAQQQGQTCSEDGRWRGVTEGEEGTSTHKEAKRERVCVVYWYSIQ